MRLNGGRASPAFDGTGILRSIRLPVRPGGGGANSGWPTRFSGGGANSRYSAIPDRRSPDMLAYNDIGTYTFVFVYDRETLRSSSKSLDAGAILAEMGLRPADSAQSCS